MVKDTLLKVLDCFDAGKRVSINLTVGGLDLKARSCIVSVLKSAGKWKTSSASHDFGGGVIYPKKDPTYEHVDITLYIPDEKEE